MVSQLLKLFHRPFPCAGDPLPAQPQGWQLTRIGHQQFLLEPYRAQPQQTTFYHDFHPQQHTTQPTHTTPPEADQQATEQAETSPQAPQPPQQQHEEADQCSTKDNPASKDETSLMQHTAQTHLPGEQAERETGKQQSQSRKRSPQLNNTKEQRPAAAKSKQTQKHQDHCCKPHPPPQEQSSSSNQAGPTPTHNDTHFPLLLSQQPPFTALQHGLPVLRDMLSYQLAATTRPQQPPQAMAAPPPPQVTTEELQLTLQIAQALTTHIQALARRIVQSQHSGTTNQPHPNDVITIDSQESHTQEQATATQQAQQDPAAEATTANTADAAETPQLQSKLDGWLQSPERRQAEAATQSTHKPGQDHQPQPPPQATNAGTAIASYPSQAATTTTQQASGNDNAVANQPWWILGHHATRSRSPPERRGGDIFRDPLSERGQRMTQCDAEEDTDGNDMPMAERDSEAD